MAEKETQAQKAVRREWERWERRSPEGAARARKELEDWQRQIGQGTYMPLYVTVPVADLGMGPLHPDPMDETP